MEVLEIAKELERIGFQPYKANAKGSYFYDYTSIGSIEFYIKRDGVYQFLVQVKDKTLLNWSYDDQKWVDLGPEWLTRLSDAILLYGDT